MVASGLVDEEAMASEHPLHTDLAAVEDGTDATKATPLFRLSREIRDEIYDLLIASETEFYHILSLEPGKRPQTTILAATSGPAHTCR